MRPAELTHDKTDIEQVEEILKELRRQDQATKGGKK